MRLEDFIKYYEGIGILEIFPGAISNSVRVERVPDGLHMARVRLENKTHLMFSIDQIDSRIVDNPEYSYSYFRFTIGKINGENIEFINSTMSPERNIFLEHTLPPGDYIVLVEPYWFGAQADSFNLGSYSDQPVNWILLPTDDEKYK